MKSTSKPVGDLFMTTHWTMVRQARDHEDDSVALRAMAALCETYWYPVYAYLRRRGNDVHRAEDLTQGFFLALIDKQRLNAVSSDKGKFRAFLLASVKNYVANVNDRDRAQKRGGGQALVPLDSGVAEDWYAIGLASDPDATFDSEWAMTTVRSAQAGLRQDYERAGKGELYGALFHTVTGDGSGQSYSEIAEQLGMSETAVKVAAHRLRSRYRKRLREAVAHTVADASSIDEELKYLIRCV